MPIPDQRDPQVTRRVLRDWLAERLEGADDLELSELTGPGATGFSNETHVFDATWTRDGQRVERGFAVRVAPTGYALMPDADFRLQYRMMEILGEHTDVPVPAVHWFEDDPEPLGAPFFVMERVEGRVPTDDPPYHTGGWVFEASPEERERMWWAGIDTIADIHRLDWRELGLGFLDRPEYGEPGLDQKLGYYRSWLDWVEQDEPVPLARRALRWLEDNRPADPGPLVLSWGDSRIGNIIFDEEMRPAAVVDWEMAALAPPTMDLAWTFFLDRHHSEGMGVERLEGFPSHGDSVERYERRSGHQVRNLRYWELLSGLRFSVIMARLSVIFKQWELIEPDNDMARENDAARLTAQMLDDLGG